MSANETVNEHVCCIYIESMCRTGTFMNCVEEKGNCGGVLIVDHSMVIYSVEADDYVSQSLYYAVHRTVSSEMSLKRELLC